MNGNWLGRLIAVALLSSGCATTLSSHQTAVPVEPGHVEGMAATGFYVPLGATASAIDVGKDEVAAIIAATANGQDYTVTPEQRDKLITAALALAVLPPSPSQEFALRTGILKNWDAGLHYSINAVKLDSKVLVYHWDEGDQMAEPYRRRLDVALGGAVSKYLFDNPILDVLEFIQMGDFDRWDFEVPVYVSMEWGYIWKAYASPRYVFSHTELDATLRNTAAQAGNVVQGLEVSVPATVNTHFFGGTVGVMVGYRWVWVAAELTGGYTYCKPFVLGQRRDLGGATFYPSLGLVVRI